MSSSPLVFGSAMPAGSSISDQRITISVSISFFWGSVACKMLNFVSKSRVRVLFQEGPRPLIRL
jgi:hypothetical protein